MKQLIYSDGDNVKLAVFAILLTVFALSLGDALIKQISADFPLWQIFVIRSIIAIPVLIAVIKARNQSVSLKPLNIGWAGFVKLTGFTTKSRQFADGCYMQFQCLSLMKKCRKQSIIG